jgi:predicted secreted protein
MMIDNIDDMTATAFRQAYGVPVVSLGETRETLATMREASREMTGDTWREEMAEWLDEVNGDSEDEEAEREEPITMRDARGYGWSVTNEMVDCLED